MRILQILPELNVGGVERGTVDFAKYLVDKGHASFVISNGGKMVEDLQKAGSQHFYLPVHRKSLLMIFRLIKPLRKFIVEHDIDIVHARSRVPAWIAFFACRGTKATFITTCHGYYKSKWTSQVMGFGKKVIVPSHIIGNHMVEDFGVRPEMIEYIPRSVDLDRFKLTKFKGMINSRPTIIMVGRITLLKGHTYFFQAMAKVVHQFPQARIQVIGSVPVGKETYLQELQMLVRRLGIHHAVEFLGNRQDIPELLAKADVLVMSSTEPESFGRVILEAQDSGIQVVATRVGGVVEIIDDEETGFLVNPKDIDAMAQKVVRLLQDPQLGKKFTERAQEKILNNFTIRHMSEKTLKVYDDAIKQLNILVIKISSIGDVILVTPSLKAIRKKFPHSRIYGLVGKESVKILQNCPYIDGVIPFDAKHSESGWFNVIKLGGKLFKYRFDKIVDFQNNRKSHLLCFLSFARKSYGFDNKKWSFFLTHRLRDYQNNIAAVAHQYQLLDSLGIKQDEAPALEMWPSAKDKKYAEDLLESEWLGNAKNIVGINIAASAKWQTKNWPLAYIAQLVDALMAQGIRVVVTGMEKDKELAAVLLSMTKSKPSILVGKTDITQLACVIKKCRVYITPDSAPLHIAAAVGTPVIALFGPTSSERHLPPAKRIIVLEEKLTCAPCYSARCKIMTHACMKGITPEVVYQQIMHLIGKTNENPVPNHAS